MIYNLLSTLEGGDRHTKLLVIYYYFGEDYEYYILPTPGEAKAKAMPGRLYIHTKINNK
jgi:hypothetical protein